MEKRSTQVEVRLQATITTLQQELEQQEEEHHKDVWRNRKFVGQLSWFAGSEPLSLSSSFQLSSRHVGSCWRCRIRYPANSLSYRCWSLSQHFGPMTGKQTGQSTPGLILKHLHIKTVHFYSYILRKVYVYAAVCYVYL